MSKTAKTAVPTITRDLAAERTDCPHCGRPARADYANHRTVHTLDGVTRLNPTVRRCHAAACPADKRPDRPEAEGAVALPRHEFGLDVVALVGRLRYAEHRSGKAAAPCARAGSRQVRRPLSRTPRRRATSARASPCSAIIGIARSLISAVSVVRCTGCLLLGNRLR